MEAASIYRLGDAQLLQTDISLNRIARAIKETINRQISKLFGRLFISEC